MCVQKKTRPPGRHSAHLRGQWEKRKGNRAPFGERRKEKRKDSLAKRGRVLVSASSPIVFGGPLISISHRRGMRAADNKARKESGQGSSVAAWPRPPPPRQGFFPCYALFAAAACFVAATLLSRVRLDHNLSAMGLSVCRADRGKPSTSSALARALLQCGAAVFPDLLPRCSGRAKDDALLGRLVVEPERGVLAPRLTSGAGDQGVPRVALHSAAKRSCA